MLLSQLLGGLLILVSVSLLVVSVLVANWLCKTKDE